MAYAYNSTNSIMPSEAKADIVNESSIKEMHLHHQFWLHQFWAYDEHVMPNCELQMFDIAYWHAQNAVTGHAQGRGVTWFFRHRGKDLVLRHFYRGGLIGRFINDDFIFTGHKHCRAAREFYLLHSMYQNGLPVPRPIAFQVHRKGLLYTNNLILERIPDTQSLVSLLESKQLNNATWFAIGGTIKAFHNFGIYHHDLNSHNILLNEHNHVWLIDFDRGAKFNRGESWKKKNLNRLKRSLCKESRRLPAFEWCETQWQHLLDGYAKG